MIRIIAVFLLSLLVASTSSAQEMPAPRRMPRTPVSSEALDDQSVSGSREIVGQSVVIDGERLRIGKAEMRLFGVVPPQLSASFGPQARAHIDMLAGGQNVNCHIRDRDRDGRLLATCTTANGTDMAHDLLKRGLAVAARGSLVGTELASAYASAEQSAQNQKIGLWSLTSASAATAAHPKAEAKQEAASPTPAPTPAPVEEAKKDEKTSAKTDTQMQAKVTADILAQKADADAAEETVRYSEPGFLEKYQLLVSGLLMLGTALFIVNALNIQRLREKREEIKALAAALRGELMAARSICLGKANCIMTPADDRTAVWPRIRTTLYQAYVGRLGLLGADLARRIASIYGQSGDYAALYNPACPPSSPGHEVPKKQALDALIKHIDEVLPRLAEIEKTGTVHPLSFAPRTLAPLEQRMPLPIERRVHVEEAVPAARTEDAEAVAPAMEPEAHQEPVHQDVHYEVQQSQVHPPMQSEGTRAVQQRSAVEVMSGFWEHTRAFVTNLRAQDASPRPEEPPMDPNAAEYTAIIEADMERYQREAASVAVGGRRK